MSLNQWKVLNQLKQYVSKLSDKSINNELTQLLQQLPLTYVNNIRRYLESNKTVATSVALKVKDSLKGVENLQDALYTLRTKIQNGKDDIIKPKWKKHALDVSKSTISSRTNHVISSIRSAENEQSLLKRIEDLSSHIKQFPEAKNGAVKAGVIALLLQIRRRTKDDITQAAIREAFALLGYTDALPGRGIRILSIDGGGIRGLLVIEMLKKLEELTGQRVHEMFDLICGVSTGAIIASSLAIHHKDLNQISRGYKDFSNIAFKQSTIKGTSSLVWSQSYYDTSLWEKLLKEHLGDEVLIKTVRDPKCSKFCAVSAIVNQSRLSAYVFRNYSLPYRIQSQYAGGYNHKVWEAARASAAAPTYFEECRLGDFLHQDGGILVNNPAAIAIHEAKLLWPESEIQCVVSFGTGRIVPNTSDNTKMAAIPGSTSWANKFMKILDSATDTEAVHIMLSDLLPEKVYYRFNPYLTEMLGMTEIDPKKIEGLERDAIMYLRRNEDKFQEAAEALKQKKMLGQKMKDRINYGCELYGLTLKKF